MALRGALLRLLRAARGHCRQSSGTPRCRAGRLAMRQQRPVLSCDAFVVLATSRTMHFMPITVRRAQPCAPRNERTEWCSFASPQCRDVADAGRLATMTGWNSNSDFTKFESEGPKS